MYGSSSINQNGNYAGQVDALATQLSGITLQDQGPPYKPGLREKNEFYSGLPGQPRLIARTTGISWDPQSVKRPKVLRPVGHVPALAFWNSDDDFVSRITTILSDDGHDNDSLSCMDLVRIGHLNFRPNLNIELEFPVIAWIGVKPSFRNGDWARAKDAALAIRRLFIERGANVHCEIRVANVNQLSRLLPIGDLKWQNVFALVYRETDDDSDGDVSGDGWIGPPKLLVFSEAAGQPIGSNHVGGVGEDCRTHHERNDGQPMEFGTLGLYLQVGEQVYGLTCQHSVSTPSAVVKRWCFFNGETHSSHWGVEDFSESIDRQWSWPTPEKDQQRLAIRNITVNMTTAEGQPCSFHNLGRVGPSRAKTLDDELDDKSKMRDWALIELDQERFTTPLQALENKVWVGRASRYAPLAFQRINNGIPPGPGHRSFRPSDDDGFMLMRNLRRWDRTISMTGGIRVCKAGAGTGVTFGQTNDKTSVEWMSTKDVDADTSSLGFTRRWAIFDLPKTSLDTSEMLFAGRGDSGAVVLDFQGRAAGLLLSAVDGGITYADPMEWVLEDIAALMDVDETEVVIL